MVEDKITWDELAPSLQALFKKLQKMIEDEIARAKDAENKLNIRINNIWGSDGEKSTHDITEIWKNLGKLNTAITNTTTLIDDLKDTVNKNVTITIGYYGQSPVAEPEIPGHRSDPNSMGEWLLNPNSEFGKLNVYRHAQITTTEGDIVWPSLNEHKNVKFCRVEDSIFVSFENKFKEYFISVPFALPCIFNLDGNGALMSGTGRGWESKINAGSGGSISSYSGAAYTDLGGSSLAKNIPVLNGTNVSILRIVQIEKEWVTLSIPAGYIILLDDYKKIEYIQHQK